MTSDDPIELVAWWADEAASALGERNNCIRAAHDEGRSLRAIAEAAKLSVEGVRRIIARTVSLG
jgi:hypothetical protein